MRDYLKPLDWNKKSPAPKLPPEVIAKTAEKYREALTRLVDSENAARAAGQRIERITLYYSAL